MARAPPRPGATPCRSAGQRRARPAYYNRVRRRPLSISGMKPVSRCVANHQSGSPASEGSPEATAVIGNPSPDLEHPFIAVGDQARYTGPVDGMGRRPRSLAARTGTIARADDHRDQSSPQTARQAERLKELADQLFPLTNARGTNTQDSRQRRASMTAPLISRLSAYRSLHRQTRPRPGGRKRYFRSRPRYRR